jgi:hypothetical protein
MFGILESVAKAAVSVVTLPVSVAADIVTMGGAVNDKDSTYTGENLSNLVENLKNATDPNK